MNDFKTIIVSNRLPVKIEWADGDIICQRSEGGLATGLSCVYNEDGAIWIGWPGVPATDDRAAQQVEDRLRPLRLKPVSLNAAEIEGFYEGFSNETLWPLFHYFPTYASFDSDQWKMYQSVNRKFADAILATAKPGDRIWIHDYHLLLVPAMIRAALPGASIGFFQHIPFPSYEVFRLLPWRNELLKGMLGADLVGFHTEEDADHFVEAVQYLTEAGMAEASILSHEILVEDRSVTVSAFPMGIDYEKYRTLSCSPAAIKIRERIMELCGDQQLMVSVDRLDYSKGILHRLKAYDRFLQQHPEFHEKVIFIQLIVPSRDQVPQYGALKEEINQLVSDINTRYSSFDWEPIRYWYRSLSPETLSALYAAADVALVTPLRDGMNLVSKEYVASKTQSPGVLILSEMAGAAQELKQALIINPNDEEEMAAAIYQALIMPVREQVKRMNALQRTVSQHHVHLWAHNFLEALDEIKAVQEVFDRNLFSREIEAHVLEQFITRANAASILDQLQVRPDVKGEVSFAI